MTNPSTRPEPASRGPVLGVVAVVLLTAAVYWSILDANFIDLDDGLYVFNNPHVLHGINSDSLRHAFTEKDQANWIPLTLISYLLDVELFGVGPAGFHFTNLVFHLLNTCLVFFAFRELTRAPWRSLVVAALFALHPVHVESVAWISSRKDVLSGTFFLLGLIVYAKKVHGRPFGRRDLLAICYLLALMAKPTVITLPFVLLLLDFWPLRRIEINAPLRDTVRTGFQLIGEKIGLFAIMVVFGGITVWTQGQANAYGANLKYSFMDRVQNALVSYSEYVFKCVWPVDLAPLYPLPLHPYPMWQVAAAALFLLAVTAFVVFRRATNPAALMGWFWFLGTMVPMAGFIQVGNQAYADRYTYLPYLGLFVLAVWTAARAVPRFRVSHPAIAVVSVTIVSVFALLTFRQAALWSNTKTLFTHTLEVTDENALAHNTLGAALARSGDPEGAVSQFSKAIELVPAYIDAHYNLAGADEALGNHDGAMREYQQVLHYDPDHPEANNNYGSLLARLDRPEEAIPHLLAALRAYPGHPVIEHNLGLVLQDLGRYDEAIQYLSDAEKAQPDDVWCSIDLAISLEAVGRVEEARERFDKAIQAGIPQADIDNRRIQHLHNQPSQ